MNYFKCDICGQFISYAELESGEAMHELKYPDSDYTCETWETYHVACEMEGCYGPERST